jgi:phosphoserine phosphatase
LVDLLFGNAVENVVRHIAKGAFCILVTASMDTFTGPIFRESGQERLPTRR